MKTVYLLIAITGTGHVDHSIYHTQRQCDEAKSMALYGETVEQFAEDEIASAKDAENAHDQWAKDHPPRPPKNTAEREMIARHIRNKTADYSLTDGLNLQLGDRVCSLWITDDNLLQDVPCSPYTATRISKTNNGGRPMWVHGELGYKDINDIETAECIKTDDSP